MLIKLRDVEQKERLGKLGSSAYYRLFKLKISSSQTRGDITGILAKFG